MLWLLVWLVLTLVSLSVVGMFATRLVAIGMRARLVIGVGPHLAGKPGGTELRLFPSWFSTDLEGGGARAFVARAAAPLTMLLLPSALVVMDAMFVGYDVAQHDVPAILGEVVQGSPADRAGARVGDVVLGCGDRVRPDFAELIDCVHERGGEPVALTLRRAGRDIELSVRPERIEGRLRIGVSGRIVRRYATLSEATMFCLRAIAGVWGVVLTAAWSSAVSGGPSDAVGVIGPAEVATLPGLYVARGILNWFVAVSPLAALLSAIEQTLRAIRGHRRARVTTAVPESGR
jgi:membrane-associated protease RseP (regulator of RpoE activity)